MLTFTNQFNPVNLMNTKITKCTEFHISAPHGHIKQPRL